MYTPPLTDGELLLGDKAYSDQQLHHQIIAPIKARPNQPLMDAQLEYNKLHGWYRASIEHCFGYIKRFRIIGNHAPHTCNSLNIIDNQLTNLHCVSIGTVYRGKLSFLRHVIKIIIHADAMYLHSFPHREYPSIAVFSVNVVRPEFEVARLIDNNRDGEVAENNNDDSNNNRRAVNDLRHSQVDARWAGINTGNSFGSFELHDTVMAWYDDAFYIATIVEIDNTNQLFTVHFIDDHLEVNSYEARWLKHLE
jgi:hypothetical protein